MAKIVNRNSLSSTNEPNTFFSIRSLAIGALSFARRLMFSRAPFSSTMSTIAGSGTYGDAKERCIAKSSAPLCRDMSKRTVAPRSLRSYLHKSLPFCLQQSDDAVLRYRPRSEQRCMAWWQKTGRVLGSRMKELVPYLTELQKR
jgi:hypothetical protein